MRTFQLLFIVLFLVFYVSITIASVKSLSEIIAHTRKRKIQYSVFIFSGLIILAFISLYIWPLNTRTIDDYSMHLVFNIILSIDFIFKISLALAFFVGIFFKKNHKTAIYFIGLLLSLGISNSVIYGSLFGTKELLVNHIELRFQNLPPGFNGYTFMQISDIHFGNFLNSKRTLKKVVKASEKENVDAVFFTGDMVNNFAKELDGWNDIFTPITKNRDALAILGNHDYGDYTEWKSESDKAENFNQIIKAQEKFGFQFLNNNHAKLKMGSDSIYIVGVENWGHPPFPQYANLDSAMAGIPKESFKILLSHDPAHWEKIVKFRNDISLTLSGHSHGLQWGIRKAGITFSLSYLTRRNWGGLYEFENSKLYVNTGLGTVGMIWRINMPAEITIITLKGIEVD